MKRLRRRIRALFDRRRLDRDLDDELRFHLDMLSRERPDARRQFGNYAHLKETCRDMWTLNSIETWLQDFRYGFRALAKAPGFTTVAITALALGIGANAFVFTLVNAILFKNMPFADSEHVLYVSTINPAGGGRGVSHHDYLEYRAQAKSFEDLGAYSTAPCSLSDSAGAPEGVPCARLTANTFSALGIRPAAGRDFLPEDEKPGAPPTAILTHNIWESRYGRDPSVIGKQVRVDAAPATVIGIMPRGIRFPGETSVYLPQSIAGREADARLLTVFGRLRPGVARSSAAAEIETITQNLAEELPATHRNLRALLQNYNDLAIKKGIRMVFYVLLGAVGFVLLTACCNVANLMLARAIGRTREVSIRAALGASRWRVVRQLLSESLILSAAGGSIGCLLAVWCARAFDVAVIPTGKPVWIDFSMDYRVLAYVAAISIGTGILFGLAPALRVSRPDLQSVLKEGGRGFGPGTRGRYLAGALVVAEMALAVVLLIGAGLMIRSFLKAYGVPIGVNPANVLTMRIDLPNAQYEQPQKQLAFYGRLQAELQALPGVGSVTALSRLPGTNARFSQSYQLEGAPPVEERSRPAAGTIYAGPDYFNVLQISLRAGHAFDAADHSGAPVVIVNEELASRAWPHEDPIGKRFRLYGETGPGHWLTVIGLAPNISQGSVDQADPLLYLPYQQTMRFSFFVAARTRVPPAALGEGFRRAVQSIDADLPVRDLMSLEEVVALNRWTERVFGSIFAIFAVIAFVLASVGLYAVVAHSVNQRTHEIGVRLAMGAPASRVLKMVFAQGMRQVGLGLAIGLAGAWSVTRVLQSLLEGVSPRDPATFAGVTIALVIAGALGCAVPARRAVRVDPAITLRHE